MRVDVNTGIFRCTVCGEQVNQANRSDINEHPTLKVLVCKKCLEYYGDGALSQDEDRTAKYCRWCADGGDLILCTTCPNGFCMKCLKRNLGRTMLQKFRTAEEWKCLVCEPYPLKELHAMLCLIQEYHQFHTKRLGKGMKKFRPGFKQTLKKLQELRAEKKKKGFTDEMVEESYHNVERCMTSYGKDATRIYLKWQDSDHGKEATASTLKKLQMLLDITRKNLDRVGQELERTLVKCEPDALQLFNAMNLPNGIVEESSSTSLSDSSEEGRKRKKRKKKVMKKEDGKSKKVEKVKSGRKEVLDKGSEKQTVSDGEEMITGGNSEERGQREPHVESVTVKAEPLNIEAEDCFVQSPTTIIPDSLELLPGVEDATNSVISRIPDTEEDQVGQVTMDIMKGEDDDQGTTQSMMEIDAELISQDSEETEDGESGPTQSINFDCEVIFHDSDEELRMKEMAQEPCEMENVGSLDLSEKHPDVSDEERWQTMTARKALEDILADSNEADIGESKMQKRRKKMVRTKGNKQEIELNCEKWDDMEMEPSGKEDEGETKESEKSKEKSEKKEEEISGEKLVSQEHESREDLGRRDSTSTFSSDDEDSDSDTSFLKVKLKKKKKRKSTESRTKKQLSSEVQVMLKRLPHRVFQDDPILASDYITDEEQKKKQSPSLKQRMKTLLKSVTVEKKVLEDEDDEGIEEDQGKQRKKGSRGKKKSLKKDRESGDGWSSDLDEDDADAGIDVKTLDGVLMQGFQGPQVFKEQLSLTEVNRKILNDLLKSSDNSDTESEGEQEGKKVQKKKVGLEGDKMGKDDEVPVEIKEEAPVGVKEEAIEVDNENVKEESLQRKHKFKKEKSAAVREALHLLRIKFSDTDTSEEEKKCQKLEKAREKKKQDYEGSFFSPGRKRKQQILDSSDPDSGSDKSHEPKAKRKKAIEESDDSSIQLASPSPVADSDEEDNDVTEIVSSQSNDSPSKDRRKNIHKILKDSQLKVTTQDANREERERLARISEKQKLFNEVMLQELEEVVNSSQEKGDLILDFDRETKESLVEVHSKLVQKLKPHQREGIQFMFDACIESVKRKNQEGVHGGGCILGHCMGLGKTLQKGPVRPAGGSYDPGEERTYDLPVVAFLHTVLTCEALGFKTALVLCPYNTVLNWDQEFKMWLERQGLNEFDIFNIANSQCLKYGHSEKNADMRMYHVRRWHQDGGVMIMGYDKFRLLANPNNKKLKERHRKLYKDAFMDPGPDLVVCDEGHILKNEKSLNFRILSQIKTRRRIVLTGTPLQNNLKEYHCMIQFVKPNLLGTMREFTNRFMNPIENGQHSDSTEADVNIMRRRAHVLHDLLKGCVQRKDYGELAQFLPPKLEYVVSVRLSPIQIALYQHYLENNSRFRARQRGGGTSLFSDFQRMWEDDGDDEQGSLKDFVVSDEDSDSSSSSTQSSATSRENTPEDDDIQILNEPNGEEEEVAKNSQNEEKKEEEEDQSLWWEKIIKESGLDVESFALSGKMMLLADILRSCEIIGDKVLVFTQSLLCLDLVEQLLQFLDSHRVEPSLVLQPEIDLEKAAEIPHETETVAAKEGEQDEENDLLEWTGGSWVQGADYFRIDGTTPVDTRKRITAVINDAKNYRARLLLVSTKAGGLGINLVGANRVVILDASWNPSHDVQALFRVYRFGQQKPVYIYRFFAKVLCLPPNHPLVQLSVDSFDDIVDGLEDFSSQRLFDF
ncbi:unnamed protein product [Darwinula stevensoni]|uniref:ATP-dependent helicase ATRX n=1 Tax=Darwinula stevensoni TaxID=69355 RepID=A0A7R9A692_9CRUS|nr:unnamed protein product [Darwinula stevensoni]CAG0893768.1 unnamed protein product [Darwinula stevensoni]